MSTPSDRSSATVPRQPAKKKSTPLAKPAPKRDRQRSKSAGGVAPAAESATPTVAPVQPTPQVTPTPQAAQPTAAQPTAAQAKPAKAAQAKPAQAAPARSRKSATAASGQGNKAKAAAKPATPQQAKAKQATPKRAAQAARPAAAPAARPVPVAVPSQANAQNPVDDEEYGEDSGRFLMLNAVPSWMVSMIVHAVLLLILGLWLVPMPDQPVQKVLTLSEAAFAEPQDLEPPEPIIDPNEINLSQPEVDDFVPDEVQAEDLSEEPEFSFDETMGTPPPAEVSPMQFGEKLAPRMNLLGEVKSAVTGKGLDGRSQANRAKMAMANGATKESEAAVGLALAWIAAQQMRDGGWNFKQINGCSKPGSLGNNARTAATALALLPFLGAGQTHKQGKYKATVERGLYFLTRQMKVARGMGDLTDPGGRMYAHGLAAIALCEAYAMTRDRELMGPAQMSVNYICFAQDPVGGGWRYRAKQAGDTSVVGWQLMALKSAHLAYLRVPPEVIRKASKFLDSVQVNYGSGYGYTNPGRRASTTSIGLLCRMYLGWKRDNPALQDGVQFLSGIGPTRDMYYNYYATQVMRHYGGKHWENWNKKMRDSLVQAQAKRGREKGSWGIGQDHGSKSGGRLYITAMATMILEVYYRHMPIYGAQASEDEFPL